MPFRIPRLPRAVPLVGKDGSAVQMFQRWWQSVAVAIEGAIRTLDATVLVLEGVLDNLTDILVEIGLIEVKADGALELADSAINPDGTIKTSKVITDSIIPNGVTERYLVQALVNVPLPDGVETEVYAITLTKFEDESDIDLDVSLRLQSSDDLRGAMRIYRDAFLLTSFGPYMDSPGSTLRTIQTMLHTDLGVPVGTYTYRVTFERQGGASSLVATSGSQMRAKEIKR